MKGVLQAARCVSLSEVNKHVSSHPVVYQRSYASKGFVQSLIDKVKEESSRDSELKENIRKFREETAKLEQSKEIQSVRQFYKKIEKELPADTVEKVRDKFQYVREKIKEEGQSLAKNETLKKSFDNLSRAGEQIRDATKSLGDAEILKVALKVTVLFLRKYISRVLKQLNKSCSLIGQKCIILQVSVLWVFVYEYAEVLKTRRELVGKTEEKIIQPDSESSGVVVHKDSKWYSAWQDFKDNNQYVQKFFDLKAQYEESDHLLARSIRFVSDKVSHLFGKPSSLLMTAIVRCDLKILKDWCYEAPFNVLATPLRQIQEQGLISESRVLDVHNVDIQMGKMMEQGPVLVITFQAQQINCIRDKTGTVREGDPHKVLRVTHVWALCRDQSEFHPWAAWRLLDIAMMPTEQWL
ncbi:Mitochondrial import inner membrane translocase subunit TIM44 [Fasciola gigantica]|uniref:Mitochondrial import inner membrane translocase subunit TIM44 n=1 Tax=Fasciola gigantica TaxID=46835 RepID=A0A504YIG0_FASGI|nr:Mitochondrial import inner membrane translocase subunit TIM44 [Fasciola gigantica]